MKKNNKQKISFILISLIEIFLTFLEHQIPLRKFGLNRDIPLNEIQEDVIV